MTTIHDVAQRAGVSSTTVSRYLNNRIELPAATATRIDAAIKHLDYRPNAMAKRLSTGKTEAIGMVVPDIREPVFAELAAAVEEEAERHGYTLLLSTTANEQAREVAALERLRDGHVDGLILTTEARDDGTLARLIERDPRVVLVGEDIAGATATRVFIENEQGAYEAALHLIEHGHREIALIAGPDNLTSARERRAGYMRAMREAGLPIHDDLIRTGSYSPEFARKSIFVLLRRPLRPTAIIAASDSLVIGALLGLKEAGASVPRDISVIGFDDVARTRLLQPDLTSMRVPIEVLGQEAFRSLRDLLTDNRPAQLKRVPMTLVERRSVAKRTLSGRH